MPKSFDIRVDIVGDSRSVEKAFNRSTKAAQQFQSNFQRSLSRVDRASSALKGGLLGGGLAGGFVGGVAATAALDQLRKAVDVASNLAEQTNKSRVVFGQASDDVEQFAQTSARSFGVANDAALETTGTFGNLFASVGLAQDDAAQMSVALVKLASDLASFNNADPTDVLDALRSGLIGEAEPLRRFGVLLSEARVQQEALRQTGKSTAAALTDQEKVTARYALILKDTAVAQGDFGRTSEGLANKQRVLEASVRDLQASIGTALIPTLQDLVNNLTLATVVGGGLAETLRDIGSIDIGGGEDVGGVFSRWLKVANPLTLQLEVLKGALDAVGQSGKDAGTDMQDGLAAFEAAFEPFLGGGFQVPATPSGPAGFGDPGFKPKGFEFLTGIPDAQQIDLLKAEATDDLKKQLDVLARQRKTLQAALGQAGLSKEDEITIRRDLAGVVSGIKAINDQILEAAQASKKAAADKAAAQAQKSEDAFNELIASLGLQLDKAGLTRRLNDDLEVLRATEAAIEKRIKAEGKTAELARSLFETRQQIRATQQQQRDRKQFSLLGLDETGGELTPDVKSLKKQLGSISDAVEGTFLDTNKTRSLLANIRKILKAGMRGVSDEVRQAISRILDDFDKQVGGSEDTADKFKKARVSQMFEGIGLSPDELRAVRAQASQIGRGGTLPTGGASAFGTQIGGTVVVQGDVILDGQKVGRVVTTGQNRTAAANAGSRRGTRAGQNRGVG